MARKIVRKNKNDKQPSSLLIFLTTFFVSFAILLTALYYTPSLKNLVFDSNNLRPSAEQLDSFEGNVFSDINSSHPFALSILYLKSKGVFKGYEDGSFRPNDFITRGEVIKLVVGSLHIFPHHVSYRHCYLDVNDEWFAPYVCYAKYRGWISGENKSFLPMDNITVAEFLKIVIEAYKVLGLEKFDDSYDWFFPYLKLANEKGWVDFYYNFDEFYDLDPFRKLTRGEVAELLFNIMQTEDIV